MFNKILVPLDGSELAERALAPALTLGAQAEDLVMLLRAVIPEKTLAPDVYNQTSPGILWPDQALEPTHREALDYLETIQKSKSLTQPQVLVKVVEGDVAEVILDTVAVEQVGLIVMSSHGYAGVTRWMLGSVAEKLLHSALCPVLVIRSPQPIRHMLIPLDGSELSEKALAPGLAVAAGLGCDVTLLRAVKRVQMSEIERLDQCESGLGLRLVDDLHEEAEAYLSRLATTYRPSGLRMETIVLHEPAGDSILHYTERHGIDLIAMSTHGRTGLQRWVYGSVTEKMLHGGSHSMLIVRPASHALN
jgi:nucleotide-binding universal stress UspA family protein